MTNDNCIWCVLSDFGSCKLGKLDFCATALLETSVVKTIEELKLEEKLNSNKPKPSVNELKDQV